MFKKKKKNKPGLLLASCSPFPTMAMLPFCDSPLLFLTDVILITLLWFSQPNLTGYLTQDPASNWGCLFCGPVTFCFSEWALQREMGQLGWG